MESYARKADDLVVRAAEPTDLEAIHALECASFVADRLSRRALRRFIEAPHRPLIVARSHSALAGYSEEHAIETADVSILENVEMKSFQFGQTCLIGSCRENA